MNYNIHKNEIKGYVGELGEIKRDDTEEKVVKLIVDIVCKNLNITWNDRRVVNALLENVIGAHLIGRQKLLEQYLHTQLDIIVEKYVKKYDLSKEIKVNYSHTTHAKLDDLMDAIREATLTKQSEEKPKG
jgi:transcriptional regulatory protein LevR